MYHFNFQSQPFSSRSQVPATLARFLRNRYETLRLAFAALDVDGLGYLTHASFTAGLERSGYPYSGDARQLFELMTATHGDRLRMDAFVTYLEKQLGEVEGPMLSITPSHKDRGTCSAASNCSTTLTGGATPDCSSSQAGMAMPEELSLELESLKVHLGRRINAMEDEFRSRLQRLEDRLDAVFHECRDECKDEVQQVQAGLLAVVEKATNLAAESKRECDRVGARTKWCSVPLVEAMLCEKLDEVTCSWQAAVHELKAVSEERWWGVQALTGTLSAQLQELKKQSNGNLSAEPLVAELKNGASHPSSEVVGADDDGLGSILKPGDSLTRSWQGLNMLSRVVSCDGEESASERDFGALRDSLPPASNKSLPGAALR